MNKEEGRVHWREQGHPWRTEPEVDANRQEELSRHRAIIPDIEKGISPFKGMKLPHADIEWLLATHEDGRGPVDWSDTTQHDRKRLGHKNLQTTLRYAKQAETTADAELRAWRRQHSYSSDAERPRREKV